ncbi:hypothetical protein ACRAKI_22310 [Saccharothrix isguenensis]
MVDWIEAESTALLYFVLNAPTTAPVPGGTQPSRPTSAGATREPTQDRLRHRLTHPNLDRYLAKVA